VKNAIKWVLAWTLTVTHPIWAVPVFLLVVFGWIVKLGLEVGVLFASDFKAYLDKVWR